MLFVVQRRVAARIMFGGTEGFGGASSVERIPIEPAVTEAVRALKDQPLRARSDR